MASYSGALFVAGGSGITFALSAIQDLVRSGSSDGAKFVDLVWSIRDVGEFFLLNSVVSATHTPWKHL